MARRKRNSNEKTLETIIMLLFAIPLGIIAVIKWITEIFISNVRTRAIELHEVDSMDGWSFEHFTANVLRKNGFTNVAVTSGSGDFGVDIIAKRDGRRWAFQCKNYQSKLGVKPIQEVYSGAAKYKAENAVVITNSYFTMHAQQLAKALNVQLWDRTKLAELITCASKVKEGEQSRVEEQGISLRDDTATHTVQQREAVQQLATILSKKANQDKHEELRQNCEEIVVSIGDDEMATVLGPGKYIFGEDIPLGKYTLKAIAGNGMLSFQKLADGVWDEEWLWFGVEEGSAKTYYGLSLPKNKYFEVTGNVTFEITKAKMIEID